MPRPYWSGQIRLSLVTLPVNVYSAINSTRQVPLHEIYRPSGERVRHQNIAENSGKVVEREDIVKGYEIEKGEYVLIEPEEIDELKIPSSKTLNITQFVDTKEIDPLYFEKPYFVAPDGEEAEQAFVIIREALRSTGKLGLGQLAIAGRERLCSLKPCGSGMLLETLRYEDEIRESDPYFEDIDEEDIDADQLSLAKELIKRKTAKFDPGKFHDHYREALMELIEAKAENRAPRIEQEKPADKVVNLMDALKRSLGEDAPKASGKKKTAAKAAPKKKPAPKRKTTATRRKAS